MITKECLEARWKIIICGAIALVLLFASTLTYDLLKNIIQQQPAMPSNAQQLLSGVVGSYSDFIWGQWFAKNGAEMLAVMAAILGSGLISGEIGRGTIYFLLGKPLSRDRIILTKYAISAVTMLAVTVLCSVLLLIIAAIEGYPQSLGGVAISTLLLWIGELFVLGLALLFSVIFDNTLTALICALAITILCALPALIPSTDWSRWSLTSYWISQSAYLGNAFPGKELLICLIAAIVPPVIALFVFRRRAF